MDYILATTIKNAFRVVHLTRKIEKKYGKQKTEKLLDYSAREIWMWWKETEKEVNKKYKSL